jgi:HK97 family phage major capsid protein
MPTLKELQQKSADLIDKARAEETRLLAMKPMEEWSVADQSAYLTMIEDATKAKESFDLMDRTLKGSKRLEDFQAGLDTKQKDNRDRHHLLPSRTRLSSWKNDMPVGMRTTERNWQMSERPTGQDAYADAWSMYLRTGKFGDADQMAAISGMSSDNEERAGVFQASEQFMNELIKNVDDSVFVQRLSRVIQMPPAKSLGVRVRRTRASTFQWAGENTDITPTKEASLSYGKRMLTPNYLQGYTSISRDLLRNVPSSESMVIEEIGVDFNYKLEPAFLTGTGTMQPMGLLTASVDGISTARDFTSDATNFTFDDFTRMKYSLKTKYRGRATWLLHRLVLQATALLKDGNGQYLWQPSRQIGFPDMILGNPVIETEWMPNAVTSGQYYALFGDFSYYWIVYEMGMEMQRLVETAAKTNEVEYLFRCKLDAQPVLEEAFSRGKRA